MPPNQSFASNVYINQKALKCAHICTHTSVEVKNKTSAANLH